MTSETTQRVHKGEPAVVRWARRKLLRLELVHNLPKQVQREFVEALLDAYVHGYEAAVDEMKPSAS